jgi:hypothetical protein
VSKTLTIDVPDELYARLERRAELNQQSIHDEVVQRLEESEDGDDVDREALWKRIRRRRERMPTVAWDPDELKRKIEEGRA